MGITGDLLTAATLTRLVCRRGTWSLEVERLVAVERDVYQPRTQRLDGTDVVLQHLQRSANTALAHSANSLIRALHAAEECAFEALESEWVPCETRTKAESCRPSALAAANATVLELRAELCLLRATQAGLRDRLARLESQLASAHRLRELAAPRSLPPIAQPTPLSARPAPVPASLSPEPPKVQQPKLEPLEPPAPEVLPSPVLPAKAVSLLKMPNTSAIGVCLKTLIGKKIGLREVRPASALALDKTPYWFSRLIDDDGAEVGALVTDLMATIALGGALMMIPPAELDAQRASQVPSEDVMSAMAEVMNNLSATINHVPEGLHVRVRALEATTDGNLDWTKSAAQCVDLELEGGMGHLFLFAR